MIDQEVGVETIENDRFQKIDATEADQEVKVIPELGMCIFDWLDRENLIFKLNLDPIHQQLKEIGNQVNRIMT